MTFTEQREDLLFAVFGKDNLDKLPEERKGSSYLVEENKPIIFTVVNIRDSEQYKKIYEVQIKGVEKRVLITGKRTLIEAMGHGTRVVTPVKEGDLVRLTYLGMLKTSKGKPAYNFKIEVDRD